MSTLARHCFWLWFMILCCVLNPRFRGFKRYRSFYYYYSSSTTFKWRIFIRRVESMKVFNRSKTWTNDNGNYLDFETLLRLCNCSNYMSQYYQMIIWVKSQTTNVWSRLVEVGRNVAHSFWKTRCKVSLKRTVTVIYSWSHEEYISYEYFYYCITIMVLCAPVCVQDMDYHIRTAEEDPNIWNEMLPQDLRHLLPRPCHKRGSSQDHQSEHLDPYEGLLTTSKNRKLRWYRPLSRKRHCNREWG